jgi:ABC-type phosphate transport system substrate-binding protein
VRAPFLLALTLLAPARTGGMTPDIPFKVVVNPTNPVTSLRRTDLSDLFLKKVTTWNGGLAVMPIDQLETSAIRAAFTERVHGRSVLAVRKYWEKEMSSGSRTPPLHKTEADTVTYVKVHAGAIGYVSKDMDIGHLKVIAIE